jgi:hypothetical protein|tara:strand:+ start:1356 stop:1580 length:225 start_codon:yes stop_codon:yes gene_type:complete
MDDLMDMMVADASASDISDKIKEILYTKSAEKVDAVRPAVGAGLFGEEEPAAETEVANELETEEEPQEEEEPNV